MTDGAAGADARLVAADAKARRDALDPARSFLVQAPAGSGKTELLIQRYLALLARVDEPERILALTFTRKAAGEMRERVLSALAAAARGAAVDAAKAHEQVTRDLALAVLAQDRARGWSVGEHPSRLRILTFDALTTWLVRNAPLAAALGPSPGYADDARALYAAAATSAIADARADDPAWRRLLAHLHNDAERAVALLARLLARRDQLLRQIVGRSPDEVRAALVAALEAEVEAALGALGRAFPADLGHEIAWLAACASRELAADESQAAFAQALAACAACGGVPACTLACLPLWRTLAAWTLTKKGEPRAAVTRNIGFPAPGKDASKAKAKQAMIALIDRIAQVPGLAATLHGVATMPAPAALGDAEWAVVEALLEVVPRSAAQLAVTFMREGQVDFTQASLGALEALGQPDAPTDLLERLDARLAHLLVDEFQDTSATQLALLGRLTSGWTPGVDGRTIFAVGDPMQSIYRFREAEVRLFVEAQLQRTVAGVPVECLTLRRNFRSQKRIVDWVNATFPAVLGRVSDPTRGAVAYEEATAANPALPHAPTLDVVADPGEEALAVVRRTREALAAGSRDVAILARARTHLDAILPALREADIPFAAVELDRLAQRQAVLDLVSLTHALLQPADRLAWLAVLRAPWCGLPFADLLALAEAAPPPAPLREALDDAAVLAKLSPDGRGRVERLRPILRAACAAHGRAGVAARVRGAWLALGGAACLDEALDLETAERYFALLGEHERAGDVSDWDAFVAALDALHASSEPDAQARVRVMTMHKAKGLQFDTVILPGLGRAGPAASHELLRWRSRERGLLIAPSASPGGDPDPVYAYLQRLEKEECDAELGRLLYVACTRAQARLHLVAAPKAKATKEGEPVWSIDGSSSLAKLWPVLGPGVAPPTEVRGDAGGEPVAAPLLRAPAGFALPVPDAGLPARTAPAAPPREDVTFDWAQERARVVGTLAHRLLARLAGSGAWDDERVARLAPRVRADLASAGFADDELHAGTRRVLDVVHRTLRDARGRWIFDPAHEAAASEWGIAGVDRGAIVHLVVDRTFVAAGERWIVDFKTGTHEGGDPEAFLAREVGRYREQLQRYGRLMRALDPRPVRLALYYPLVDGGFREIPPA